MSKEDLASIKSPLNVGVTSSPTGNERQVSIPENLGSKITTVLLNGENYLSWTQSAKFGFKKL